MTDEETAEKYADKILSDPNYPFIFSKEEVKACIIKVYLDSLKCCENAYNKGFTEGGEEKQTTIDAQTCQIESRDVYLAEKEGIILRQQNEIQKLEKENSKLRGKLEKVSEWVKEQECPDGCIDCEPWDTEKLKEILK